MIKVNYSEKGPGLHETVAHLGRVLLCVDGEWFADDPFVQTIIDNYPAIQVAASVVTKIKDKAGAIILSEYPTWRQTNMLARYLELFDTKNQTEQTIEEMNLLRAKWESIRKVRNYSDALEESVLLLAESGDFNAVLNFDYESGWPVL